jgi:uncharacterized membrane protein YgcG
MWTLIIVLLAIVAIAAFLVHLRNRAADRRWQARMSALQNDQDGTHRFSWDKPLDGRPEYISPVKKDRTSRRDSSNKSPSTYHDTSLFSGVFDAPADDPPQAPAFHGGGGSFGGGGATGDLGSPAPSAGVGGGDFSGGADVGGDGD